MKNEVEYNKILENNIEALKCYNNILKNNKINCYEYGWMKTFKIELNDIEYKREFKKYLKNVDLKQKEKYIDLMEFVKWINICYKLDVFKINKIVQDYIDVEYVKYKSADYRATLNPILKINRMIRYYHDLLIQLNLLSETPEQPPQLTKDLKTDVQKNPPPPKELTQEQIENLKKYFISQFKGIGNNTNYFENLLIPDLNDIIKRQKAKECAMIAAIIYDCRYFKSTNRPTFNNWRNEFYNIMGIKTHTIYKKSVLEKENKYNELRKKFNYLNI
jgi:hypothetical protein